MTHLPDPEVVILNTALELPIEQREAYLDEACAGNAAFRERIQSLLQACSEAGDFMDPLADTNPTATVHIDVEKPGEKIGPYKLLQQIGEGGCGVVYMAEQEEPIRRRVALKVIKLGMDTRNVIARFEAERQALALMDHPNIAKVLDAGATAAGRPFFVMELVRGVRITDFCDQNKLSTAQRLRLFLQVCQAIQHAHEKGIIHRDIKPSNILVTISDGEPAPKVIDFGIAKATQGRLTDKTLFTAFEHFIGTPAYMSPEQAAMSGAEVDARSDVYSLGVLLYELLTGTTPFEPRDLLAAGFDEMRRTILEKEPPKPSTRFGALGAAEQNKAALYRQTVSPKLINLMLGDLDWIVMKALEKNRARRYETTTVLAADVAHHLNHEPIKARPPSVSYRLQKSLRRNKKRLAAAIALPGSLLIGVIIATWASNYRAAPQRTGAVQCFGMSLANPSPELLKKYQLPVAPEYRGPIVLKVENGSAFQNVPETGSMFWIVEHPAYGMVAQPPGKLPSFKPHTLRDLLEAILSCAVAPDRYRILWEERSQAWRAEADKLTNQPARREEALKYAGAPVPASDAGYDIVRVVWHMPANKGTMTTSLRLTERDIQQLRDLLQMLDRPKSVLELSNGTLHIRGGSNSDSFEIRTPNGRTKLSD